MWTLRSLKNKVAEQFESLSVKPDEELPTITLPRDAETTKSLCARCLTLLSHIITQVGDGTDYQGLSFSHSSSIRHPPSPCVICTRSKLLFDAMKSHVSFETSLRNSSARDWSISWALSPAERRNDPGNAFRLDYAAVLMTATHKRGYGWGIGGFAIYPDSTVQSKRLEEDIASGRGRTKRSPGDHPVITCIEPALEEPERQAQQLSFSSTVGPGSMALIDSWADDCARTHKKCNHIFGTDGASMSARHWFPDRLIRIVTTPDVKTVVADQPFEITARIVEKADPNDFPQVQEAEMLQYLSLSHCWGPPPDRKKKLGGREKDVLTDDKLPAWKNSLPVCNLLPTFRHAIKVCALLHVEHIWIDSLCIKQDDPDDWDAQSAVMAEVYKHSWLNICALSSAADDEGFINESRDPRTVYGFRAPLAKILGRNVSVKNSLGQECVLLIGQPSILWNSGDIQSNRASQAPLFKRAWVYQERNLSRRTLGFSEHGVVWACDEAERSEHPGGGSELEAEKLRRTQQSLLDSAVTLVNMQASSTPEEISASQREHVRSLVENFDYRWQNAIETYTRCQLTMQTDKLIAFSAIPREYEITGLTRQKRYLAGLWDMNLPFQMAWHTIDGQSTPRRKTVGEDEYVAPSWSWASIEAPIQTRAMHPKRGLLALADVTAAEVVLKKEFKFGAVKAGWLRVSGRLNRVKAMGSRGRSMYLTDTTTGEDLWFSPDTVEGRETMRWRRDIHKMAWLPLLAGFNRGSLDCICLVLAEVTSGSSGGHFVKPGDKVYRRLGSGNFGRLPSLLQRDKLLSKLGTYPDTDVSDDNGEKMQAGFKRSEEGFEEFVLI